MKITDVEAMVLQAPGQYSSPEGSVEAYGVGWLSLIKVTTDAGLVGWADVESQPHVIKAIIDAPPSGSGMFEGLRSVVVGEDPSETQKLWHKMYFACSYYGRRGAAIQAMSGIDNACWDIMGKAAQKPLCELLGAPKRDRVRAYASTLFRPTPEAMREACLGYMDEGFNAVKFGWGIFGQDADLDERLVCAARETLGDKIELLIDPGWLVSRTPDEAIRMIHRLEPYSPFWFEDFMHPENYDGYAQVADTVDSNVAAGEQESTLWGFQTLCHRGKVDILQPDLSRCGGLTIANEIAKLADENNRFCVPHAWLTDLLTSATLHFNASLTHSLFAEFNVTRSPLVRELIRNPLKLDNGHIGVPRDPGLGVIVNEEAVSKFRVL